MDLIEKLVASVGGMWAQKSNPFGFAESLLLLYIAYAVLKPKFESGILKITKHLENVEERLEQMINSVKDLQQALVEHEVETMVEVNGMRTGIGNVSERLVIVETKISTIEDKIK